MVDDLFDRDQEVSAAEVAIVLCTALEAAAVNPFFQAHREALLGAIRASALAWVSSEGPTPPGAPEGYSDVAKAAYQDVFYLIASLTGGMPHAIRVSAQFRSYQPG